MLALTLVILSMTPSSAHLLDDSPLLAQVSPPVMVPAPDVVASPQQLQADLDALRRARPSIGGGLSLLITGGAISLLGGFFLLGSATSAGIFGSLLLNPLGVLAIVSLCIGVPLTIIGIWMLYNRLDERGRIDAEMKRLRLEQQRVSPYRADVGTTPPSMVLARF